jgi:hypothetical protein
MHDPAQLLTVQFLSWVAARPRTYGDVREAWRSTCPRLTAWEDALDGELIEFQSRGGRVSESCPVALTPRGRALLAAQS